MKDPNWGILNCRLAARRPARATLPPSRRRFLSLACFLLIGCRALVPSAWSAMQPIMSGADWHDVNGNHIEAHEGGIFQQGGTYYLYGTDRSQNNDAFLGVNMYSSTDLQHWTFLNTILAYTSAPALSSNIVVERPKLIFCAATGQYVLWFHYDNEGYSIAEVGCATCSTIAGNYTYQTAFRPQGYDSRDMGCFQDTNGNAYLLCSVSNNTASAIFQLGPNYTNIPNPAVFVGGGNFNGEGHSMVNVGGFYFWFKSTYSGWTPNANFYNTATALAGPWTNGGDFVPSSSETYYSQNYNTMTVAGTATNTYYFMGDRWDPSYQSQDRTLWLPLSFSNAVVSTMNWYDSWYLDPVAGNWLVGSNFFTNGTYELVNRNSGLVMAETGMTNTSRVNQVAYTGSPDQQWALTNLGATQGAYSLVNVSSGRLLEVYGAASTNGSIVDVYTNNSGSNQKWRVCPTDGGYVCLLGVGSLLAVEVPNASTAPGTNLDLYARSGSNNQQWALISIGSSNLPTAPSNLVAKVPNGDIGAVELDWTPAIGASTYQVFSSSASNGPFTPLGSPVITPSYTATVTAGLPLYYTVAATNWFGSSSNAAPVLFASTNLLARYNCEGNFADTSFGAYNGTNLGATFGPGIIGAEAAQFNGTNQYAAVPNSISPGDFSVTFWMKTTGTGGSGQWWSGKGLVDGTVTGTFADFGTSLLGNKMAFGIGDPDTTIASTNAVNDGAWHLAAATFSAETGAMNLYVDGNLQNSTNGPMGARTAPPYLTLGRIQSGSGFFQGSLDDIRLYNTVLSASNVSSIYQGGSNVVSPQFGSITLLAGGSVQFTGTGAAGVTYELQAATNLAPPVVWVNVTNAVANPGGALQLLDSAATNYPHRFYRITSSQ